MKDSLVTVIGAGPAGLATAIQLKRYGYEPVVLEKDTAGGLLRNANLVENYPGFPGGISGTELVKLIVEQAEFEGVQIVFDEVLNLSHTGESFLVETKKSNFYSRIVVIASGTKPKKPRSVVIPAQVNEHVFFEVHHLLQEAGKKIAIVGAGDASFDYALNLAPENHVVILNRNKKLSCLNLLWKRACKESKIDYYESTNIVEVTKDSQGNLQIKCKCFEGNIHFQIDYLIFAIGREPTLDFLSDRLKADQERLISEGYLYYIGDVKNDIYRQTSIAIGDGIRTAMKIFKSEVI